MNTIEKEIIGLRKSLLKMFLLVENQWEKGANAILDYDQDIAEGISSSEKRINAQELKIDNECENIIALHAPVAIDLRFILTSYKINHSLEHIADIAESINSTAPQIISKYIETHDKNMLLYLLSTIRKIERAGDSLKKIAEEIIYHLEANKMKHN